MPLNVERLLNWEFADVRQTYSAKDSILYALSVGFGSEPSDSKHLRFVFERDLDGVPSMATILGHPGPWLNDRSTGVTYSKMLHAEQGLRMHSILPPHGEIVSRTKIDGIVDKGADAGAVIYTSREIADSNSGAKLATVSSTYFCRADGGFGGSPSGGRVPAATPERAADMIEEIPSHPNSGLLYRLNGDWNPIHVDPDAAVAAGFPGPLLHGLCTFGLVFHSLLKALCTFDPTRFLGIDVRFSRPVFPGDMLRTEIWHDRPGRAKFRTTVASRNEAVLTNGCFDYAV